jgi:surfeit locus 1 family protein
MHTIEIREPWQQRFRRYWWLGIFPTISAYLGVWQVQRLEWKKGVLEKINNNFNQPSVPLPSDFNPADVNENEYKKYSVRGHYLYDRELYLMMRPFEGKIGNHLITPFVRADTGDTILINRGWAPREYSSPIPDQIKDETVVGIMRGSEKGGSFSAVNNQQVNEWFWRDIPTMASVSGAKEIYLEALRDPKSEGYPIGGITKVAIPNNHLNYAVTWFSLSAALTAMTVFMIRGRTHKTVAPRLVPYKYKRPTNPDK